jgi:hypothetical protein
MIFYKNIFISAILSAILLLAIVGFIIYKYKDQEVYPPIISNCPDYYNLDANNKCVNTGVWLLTDSANCESIDFSGNNYMAAGTDSTSGLCAKKNKATECKITWDGITNNSAICAKKKT